jgi:glycosyltransferase involved in cell wall biosynthesis
MSQKNILVLIERFGQGGAEKAAAIVSQMIQEKGKVYFCSVYAPSGSYHSNEVEQLSLNIRPAQSMPQKLVNYLRKLRRLQKLKRDLNIDLTISSLWPADWINRLTGREKKVAVIQINILNNAQNAAMVKMHRVVSRVYNGFDRVVLVSANLHEEMAGFFKVRKELLTVIHNPIDARQLEHNMAERLPVSLEAAFSRHQLLIAANRLHDIKNTASLVLIYKELPSRNNLKLVLVGAGEEEQNIKALITQQGLRYTDADNNFDESADVYFLGFRSNIHHYVQRAKLFLLPTKGEGFPLALLEAMYCRVPVLVSDCPNGGVFEIMEGKGVYDMSVTRTQPERTAGGYLMPIPTSPATVDAWVRCIEELLHAPAEEIEMMKDGNRARALNFDTETLKKKWFQLIDELLYEAK